MCGIMQHRKVLSRGKVASSLMCKGIAVFRKTAVDCEYRFLIIAAGPALIDAEPGEKFQ